MSNIARMMQRATAGAGGATLDVDEVFSTFVYEGSESVGAINNGIDLSGKGGLVWTRERDNAAKHLLIDTERGLSGGYLSSDRTDAAATDRVSESIDSFNSNGYTLDTGGTLWDRGTYKYVSWTFRKAKKFFDIVTYTGNGTRGKTVSHNLGSIPGMIIIKQTSGSEAWAVYHRSIGATKHLRLNTTATQNDDITVFADTEPTSSVFSVGEDAKVNQNGGTYVAYLFAHHNNDGEFGPDSDQDIISCGSVNASSTFTLPWQPQWILSKDYNRSYDWHLIDNMRGFTASSNYDNYLEANNTNVEQTAGWFDIDGNTLKNRSGGNIIYMAIRRGPLAVPEDATKVFGIDSNTGQSGLETGILNDMGIVGSISGTDKWYTGSRLTQGFYLQTNNTNAEPGGASPIWDWDSMNSFFYGGTTWNGYIGYGWKRAPGYFDVTTFSGTGATELIKHNLGAVPEMIWLKSRTSSDDWYVFHKDLTSNSGNSPSGYLKLNTSDGQASAATWAYAPTSSEFYVTGNKTNASGQSYIAYLFATVAGVSKVGSYTGDGSTSKNIECGFSNGARFVLIKRTDNNSDWFVFDSVRGINSGTEPRLELNNTDAEPTATDQIDPYSGGFNLASQSSFNINISGASYIFYAIA